MNLQRREEISALLAAPVTGGAGQVLEYRDALMECRAHIDTLEQMAAERVIRGGSRGPTPDYTGEGSAWRPPNPVTDAALVEVRSWIHTVGPVGAMVWVDPQEALKVAGIRVLGEGMVAVDRDALSAFEEKAAFIRRYPNTPPEYFRLEAIFKGGASEVLALIDALRANQGGAAT